MTTATVTRHTMNLLDVVLVQDPQPAMQPELRRALDVCAHYERERRAADERPTSRRDSSVWPEGKPWTATDYEAWDTKWYWLQRITRLQAACTWRGEEVRTSGDKVEDWVDEALALSRTWRALNTLWSVIYYQGEGEELPR